MDTSGTTVEQVRLEGKKAPGMPKRHPFREVEGVLRSEDRIREITDRLKKAVGLLETVINVSEDVTALEAQFVAATGNPPPTSAARGALALLAIVCRHCEDLLVDSRREWLRALAAAAALQDTTDGLPAYATRDVWAATDRISDLADALESYRVDLQASIAKAREAAR